jgi:enoyl-CoA hydratase/carnithine racemase
LELLPMADLIYEKRERYAIMTMNRPHRLNAFGGSMMAELSDAMLDFNADPAMRAAIITGQGRAYSAGADLKEIAERNASRSDGPAASGMLNRGDPAAALLAQSQAYHRRHQRPVHRGGSRAGARLRHPDLFGRGVLRAHRGEARHPRQRRRA